MDVLRVWPLILTASLAAIVVTAEVRAGSRGSIRAFGVERPPVGRRSNVEGGGGGAPLPAVELAGEVDRASEHAGTLARASERSSEPGSVASEEALLAWPVPGHVVSNLSGVEGTSVVVFGAARLANLTRWVLEYGQGATPKYWVPIASGEGAPVGLRLGRWDASTFENGPYVLRLTATDVAGRTRRSMVPVRVALATVSTAKRQLDVGRGETIDIETVLPAPSHERLELRDERGATVRTIVDEWRPAGVFSDAWDGLRDDGARLPDGQYRWVATLKSDECPLVIDQSDHRDGDAEVKGHPEYPPWDAFDNKPLRFSHTFDRPGEIVLVFSRDTYDVRPSCEPPRFFCRFLDGYHPGGVFTYEWAGVDDEGRYRDDINAIFVVSHHEDLSRNGVIVHGGHPVVSGMRVSPALFRPGSAPQVIGFQLTCFRDERASAVVTWTNQESLSKLRMMELRNLASGSVEVEWDGRADGGEFVAPGRYTVAVVVTDSSGQTARGEILTRVEY